METVPVPQDHARPWPAAGIQPLAGRPRGALLEIEQAVRAARLHPHEAVAQVLERRVTEADLLDGIDYPGSPDRYTRHLIYAGPGFSILALVWRPGQMSPIHGHRSWCALGIRQGKLVETSFLRGGSGGAAGSRLTLESCRQLDPGMISHSDGAEDHYHRVANLGVETAVSIHVYGVAFDRLGHGLNRIWEDEP